MVVIKIQEYLDELNDGLIYTSHIEEGNTLIIKCEVKRLNFHPREFKPRRIYDIPYNGKMVILKLRLPVYYTDSTREKCFSHKLNCCEAYSSRTKRLDEYIIEYSKNSKSFIELESNIRGKICEISDTSLFRLLKKNNISLK